MAGGKETPRQKMIGMMYLVLTALLALNVSAEVLEAFSNITRGINQTIVVSTAKNNELLEGILARVGASGETDTKAKAVGIKAKEATVIAKELYDYLEELKVQMVTTECDQTWESYVNGDEDTHGKKLYLIDPKNIDVATMIFVEKGAKPKSGGEELKDKINETREKLVGLFDGIDGVGPEVKEKTRNALTLKAEDDLEDPEPAKRAWEFKTFNSIPRGAAIAILSKIQNDVKNAESEVLNTLLVQIDAKKIVIKDFVPVVKATKSAVAVGEKYSAEIFLAAQVDNVVPEITVNGQKLKVDEKGVGLYEVSPSTQGSVEAKAIIEVKDTKTGEIKKYDTKVVYDVFKAPAIISADAMNVLYVGLDNPVSISVPGFEPRNINATLTPSSVGTLKKVGDGKYIAEIKQRQREPCKINVTVTKPDKSTVSMGFSEFRTKVVPKPEPSLNGNTGGDITGGALQAVRIVSATLPDFVFDGITYNVTKFSYIYKPVRGQLVQGKTNGKQIPTDLSGAFSNAKRGDLIIINNISASAKGVGEVQLSASLVYTVI